MGNAHGRQHQMPIDGGSLTPNDIYPADAQDFDEKIVQRLIIHRHIAPFYKGAEDPDPPLPNSVGTLSGTGDHGSVSSARGGSNSPGGFEDDAGWWSYSMHVTPKSDDEDAGPITGASEPTSPSVTATQHERRQERLTTRRSAASLQCDGSSSGQHRKSNGLRGLIIKNYHHRRQKSSEGTVARSFVSAAGSADHNAEDASIDELKRKLRRVVECPICFLYYPANINYTRCCHKPICTECFVQIKRNDELLSPANCPYCTVPEFGVIYYPPHLGADGIN
ncbi:SNF1-interacting protein, partial [Spiromyces aspiralis]